MNNSAKDKQPWYASVILLAIRILFAGPSIFRWLLALAVVAFPPIYLAKYPQHYTPLVSTLFSVFLFLLAYWIGNTNEIERAAKKANDRWLPQAESVIFRLMTLHSNVRRFSHTTRASCSSAECEMPELKTNELRAVRIKLKSDCEASGQRLDDIAHQLEDAIEDWRRFITANCYGEECTRIFDALQQRQIKLEEELGVMRNASHSAAVSNA